MDGDFDSYIGPAAGVLTSVLWTATSLLFTAAARRIGTTTLNTLRIALAVVLLGVTHRVLAGVWTPNVVAGQVVFLALSGVVGLSIGDQALFTSFVHVGPRLAMLVMATSPIFAALFGWLTLGETLHGVAWLGVVLTIGGVGWVVLERPDDTTCAKTPHRVRGVILAFVASACQAGGLLLSKQGMGHGWLPEHEHLAPQAASLLRMFFAALGMLPILAARAVRAPRRLAGGAPRAQRRSIRAGYVFTMCGAVVGPYLGVWMSLVATDRAPLGIAQTLCSLPPVFLLPFAVLIHKERISPRAAIGAMIAVSGSALLFLRPY